MSPDHAQHEADIGDHRACLDDFEQAMMRAEEAERIAAEAETELAIMRARQMRMPCIYCRSMLGCDCRTYKSAWE